MLSNEFESCMLQASAIMGILSCRICFVSSPKVVASGRMDMSTSMDMKKNRNIPLNYLGRSDFLKTLDSTVYVVIF